MTESPQPDCILALHPTAHGFGWAIFEGPLAPLDWGTAIARTNKNAHCLARIVRLVEQYAPAIVVMEHFDHGPHLRGERVRTLSRAIVELADERGIETRLYARAAIRTCFASVGARTRYEIAQAIAARIDAFAPRTPPVRKPWMSEDDRLSLFNAAAVALTHYALAGR